MADNVKLKTPRKSKGVINTVNKKTKSKSIKQRIRSIQRLLNKPDLPATVRVSQERMLEFMQNKQDEKQQYKKDAKMIKKYKMVKFFEKRKLWRQHRAVMKELNNSPDDQRTEELLELQKKILQDMNYIKYFPQDRKYISLFPAEPYGNQDVIAEQEQLHQHVNEKVETGELPQATFDKYDKESKRKKSKEQIYLDRRKPERHKKNVKVVSCGVEDDDFFLDTCGDQANIE